MMSAYDAQPVIGFADNPDGRCELCGKINGVHTKECPTGIEIARDGAKRDAEMKRQWADSPYNPKNSKYRPRKRGQR